MSSQQPQHQQYPSAGNAPWGTPPPHSQQTPPPDLPRPVYGQQQSTEPQPAASHSRKAAKPQDRLEPAPGMPVPTSFGWARLKLWYNRKRNIADPKNIRFLKVPELGKRDQAQYDAVFDFQRNEAYAENERRNVAIRNQVEDDTRQMVRALTDSTKKGTIGFVNAKGAAATTTTTVNVATVLAWETHTMTIVLDANPAAGTSAARLGKDHEQTITVQQLAEQKDKFRTFDQFITEARPNRYFVRSVSANSVVRGENPLLDAGQLAAILELTKTNCEYLLVDTANVITDEVTLRALSMCDVLVFTANVAVHDSLRKLGESMQSLREHGLRDKVESSVVVISNLPAGANLDNYKKFLNRTDMQDQIVEPWGNSFHGPFVGIPHDPEISHDQVVNYDAWTWSTRQAYREALRFILEQLDSKLHPAQPVRPIGLAVPPPIPGTAGNS